jgi:hypothetical protein
VRGPPQMYPSKVFGLLLVLASACTQARPLPMNGPRAPMDAAVDATPPTVGRSEPLPPDARPPMRPRTAPWTRPSTRRPPTRRWTWRWTSPARCLFRVPLLLGSCQAGHCQAVWDLSTWDQTEWAP